MNYPLEELVDRLVILQLKVEHGQTGNATMKEVAKFDAAVSEVNHPRTTDWHKELVEIHRKIWVLESDIRLGKEKKLNIEEVGRRALAIRDLNRLRIAVKNRIAVATGGFFETKVDHASA